MRTFGFGVVALLAFVAPGATQEGGFRVPEGGLRVPVSLGPPIAGFVATDTGPRAISVAPPGPDATDVVVTDADGVVLECWGGDFRPGEVVRLGPGRVPLAHALPWELLRLRPDRGLSGFYRHVDEFRREWRTAETYRTRPRWDWGIALPPLPLPDWFWPTAADGAEADLRFVLFLRRETVAGLPTIWALATADQHCEFTPAIRFEMKISDPGGYPRCDIARCVVLVEGGRVVAPHQAVQRYDDPTAPYSTAQVAATLAEFKAATMRYKVEIPARELPRRWAAFGPLAALPPIRP